METLLTLTSVRLKGGQGSGHHGHAGRPGKVGGSLPELHDTIDTEIDGELIPIDVAISDVVRKFNMAGISTFHSCSGHVSDSQSLSSQLSIKARIVPPSDILKGSVMYDNHLREYNNFQSLKNLIESDKLNLNWILDDEGSGTLGDGRYHMYIIDGFYDGYYGGEFPSTKENVEMAWEDFRTMAATLVIPEFKGGQGSGHYGHKGRLGKVGGSLPSGAVGVSKTPVSDSDKSLYDHIKTYADFIEKSHKGAKSQEGLVLQHGRFFTPPELGAELPDWCEKGQMKECYHNSFNNILDMPDDVYYTEGFAFVDRMDFPFAHGWLTTADGQVIDPTWDDGVTYFGIRMHKDFVIKKALKLEMSGVICNDWMCENTIAKDGFPVGALVDEDVVEKGGAGSGHHDHRGRPGKVGGSLPNGAASPKSYRKPYVKNPNVKFGAMAWHMQNALTMENEEMALDFIETDKWADEMDVLAQAWGFEGDYDLNMDNIQTIIEDIEEMVEIEGLTVRVNIDAMGSAGADVDIFWINEYGERVGRGLFDIRNYHDEKYVKWDILEFDLEFQNQDIVTDLYGKAINTFVKWNLDFIATEADVTIGRYAWARKGFEYMYDRPSSIINRFEKWLSDKGYANVVGHMLDADQKGLLDTAYQIASYDIPGVALQGADIINNDVPYEMVLPVGKAFMLDTDTFGHGNWDAKFDLTRFRSNKEITMTTNMKRFILLRNDDESGISGEGVVAEGVLFSGGKCAMHWLTDVSSIAVYDSIEELESIHGHDGKSEIIWLDVGQ